MLRYIRLVSIFIFPFILLLSLGTWQLLRMNYKNTILDNMTLQPIDLSSSIDLLKDDYKNIKTYGVFDYYSCFYVFMNNKSYYMLQPLNLGNGQYILVNRGTIDPGKIIDYSQFITTSKVYIEGLLYCNQHKKVSWAVKNDPRNNIWFWFDISAMAKHAGINLQPCIIWANYIDNPKSISPNHSIKIFNKHMEYVITWYSLSVIWIIIFIMIRRYI